MKEISPPLKELRGMANPSNEAEITQTLKLGSTDDIWALVHGRSNVGKVRSENQDRMLLVPINDLNGAALMVADGMGGHTGGSKAAQIAIDTTRHLLAEQPAQVNLYDQLRTTFAQADKAIRQHAQEDTTLSNMGTTGVAMLLLPGEFVHLYIGDSRLYHFRNGEEIYRTKDHSVVRYLEDEGLLTEEEARVHPMRSRLTSSLGGGSQDRKLVVEPTWKPEDDDGSEPDQPSIRTHQEGDIILICSDGLCGEIDTPKLHEILKSQQDDMEALTAACVEGALAAGGRDNVTVIAVKILKSVVA
jgi:PPM family protein phosphatase